MYVGAWEIPEQFDAVDKAALTEVAGCKTVMARTGAMRFEGGTLGTTCSNDYKGAAYAISQSVLEADGMTNWDRGFAADGTQVWGPEYGGYQFRRLDECQCVIESHGQKHNTSLHGGQRMGLHCPERMAAANARSSSGRDGKRVTTRPTCPRAWASLPPTIAHPIWRA